MRGPFEPIISPRSTGGRWKQHRILDAVETALMGDSLA